MSWFFGFLKQTFGFGDEERREIPSNQMNRESYGAHSVNQARYGSWDRKIGNYSVLYVDLSGTIHSAADFANSNKNSAVASESALPTTQKPVSVGKVSSSQSSSADEERREIPSNQMNRESYGAHSVNQARYGSWDRKIGNYSVLYVDLTGTIHSAADFANSNKNSAVASESALPTSQKPVSVGKVSSSQSSSADEESRKIPRNQMNRESYGAHLVNQASFGSSNREIDDYSVPFGDVIRPNYSAADFVNSNKNSAVASESALPTSQKPVSVGKVLSSQSSSADEHSREIPRNQMNRESYVAHLVNQASFGSSNREIDDYSVPFGDVIRPNYSAADFANSNKNSVVASESALPTSQKPVSVGKVSSSQSSSADVLWRNKVNKITEKPVSSSEKDPLSLSPSLSKIQSPKRPPISTKPSLSLETSSSSTSQHKKTTYVWVEKGASSTYVFPDDIKSSIEKDIVPAVLKTRLCVETYKDYFHSLLYAEDYYLEKWDGFQMKNVTLELHEAEIYMRKGKSKNFNAAADEKDEKVFVAFEMDKIPERRPFLLSRDFVTVQPFSRKTKAFQGVIYRVVKSNLVLAEFEEDFHSQHNPACEYDVKFSFNRVCLKRAHQAVAATSDVLFRDFLFPRFARAPDHVLTSAQPSDYKYHHHKDAVAVCQILRLQGTPPYLVAGPISVLEKKKLSRTGDVIIKAVLGIHRTSPSARILICAPLNNTCDVIMRSLKKEMAESDIFRANAAFREVDGVPEDILPSCQYEEEMDFFACPSLEQLKKYKVILSTYISSFRIFDQGMKVGHFSHIFLVDNSYVTEPETMVPLANFANAETTVVVTGTPGTRSSWIRSKIARQNGLMISYFERIRGYEYLDPSNIVELEG